MSYTAQYSDFNEFNRFENLDSIEAKMAIHLIYSQSKYAKAIWKLLKYSDPNALNQADLTVEEKLELICSASNDTTEVNKKRLFLAPFVDDAWQEQCASLYIFVDTLKPFDQGRSNVIVNVETVVHSKVSIVNGDYAEGKELNNPSDLLDPEEHIVVAFKNRATVLLKCLLAEFNGLYLDGIGYLQFNQKLDIQSGTDMPLFNSRSYYGHSSKFVVTISGVSGKSVFGF